MFIDLNDVIDVPECALKNKLAINSSYLSSSNIYLPSITYLLIGLFIYLSTCYLPMYLSHPIHSLFVKRVTSRTAPQSLATGCLRLEVPWGVARQGRTDDLGKLVYLRIYRVYYIYTYR